MTESPKQTLRIIFEDVRSGEPARRASFEIVWWRWVMALAAIAIAAIRWLF